MLGVLVLAAMAELVDLVDPMIGAVTYPESGLRGDESIHGFGKTFPGAATPFGMVQLSPDTVTAGYYRVRLNGAELRRNWITTRELTAGGVLEIACEGNAT